MTTMLDVPTRMKTETPPLSDDRLAPKPNLLTVNDAKAMSLATMTELFKDHINPGQLHFMKLLGFHKVKVETANGMYYTDQNGRDILDFFGGFGSLAFGHNHPRIIDARKKFQDEDRRQFAPGTIIRDRRRKSVARSATTYALPLALSHREFQRQ